MKRLITSALALTLLAGTAVAQPYHGNDGYHRDDERGYNQDRGHDNGRHEGWNNDHRRYGHHWARGDRLPREYYQDRGHYVDYRAYHLRRPPMGYRWVRADDNNFVMVAIGTGLIASIILANR